MPSRRSPGNRPNELVKDDAATTAAKKARILLAWNQAAEEEAISNQLASEFKVVARISDGQNLLSAADKLKPDVVVLDLNLPLLNRTDSGAQLREHLPNTKIVVLMANEDADAAAEVLHAWASAIVFKESVKHGLVVAVRKALQGKSDVPVSAKEETKKKSEGTRSAPKKALTARQREVLRLLAEGCTMKEAATTLGITPRTVAFHKYRIMREFWLKTNSDLVRLAMKAHIIPPP